MQTKKRRLKNLEDLTEEQRQDFLFWIEECKSAQQGEELIQGVCDVLIQIIQESSGKVISPDND